MMMEKETLASSCSIDDKPTHKNRSSPTSSSTTNPRPLLRVLCLHDANSHAHELKDSLSLLGQRLYEDHGIDLVYVNSPLAVVISSDENNVDETGRGSSSRNCEFECEPRRVWWHDDVEKSNTKAVSNDETDTATPTEMTATAESDSQPSLPPSFIGLDASLLHLQQVWTSEPFWGILGVGQGGSVASILALLPTTYPPPQCLVLYDVQLALLSDTNSQDGSVDERLCNIPCLHVGSCNKLVAQFGGVVEPLRSRQHRFVKSSLNVIGRFLVSQQKLLLGTDAGCAVVALQSALHQAEQDAADLIAQEIAANPPAALMAVIHPQHVAGWKGNKRRQPGEDGGGAPCPPEFLLNREKRSNAQEGGANRTHPSQDR